MKKLAKIVAVALLFVSATALAATNLDGTYKFQSRMKEGKGDMVGWKGTMTIKGNEITRTYTSTDGKETKFYTSTLTLDPKTNIYTLKHTKAYKPEYVGNEFKNEITLKGNVFTMQDPGKKFVETWELTPAKK